MKKNTPQIEYRRFFEIIFKQGACGTDKTRLKILDYDLTEKNEILRKKRFDKFNQAITFIKIPSWYTDEMILSSFVEYLFLYLILDYRH